jgi:hypothetical protein
MNTYIIISLKHTSNDTLAFWRANDHGYTTNPFLAGHYSEEQVKSDPEYYNDGYGSIAVPLSDIDKLAFRVTPNVKAIETFHKNHKL